MKTKLENGQKLGPQSRTVSLRADGHEGEGQRVKVDTEKRMVVGVSVSSDEPYERFFGSEILLHTPEAVNLTRFKKKAAPLLLNHNRDKLIGKPLNPRLEDGRLVVDLKFAQNALATECLKDLEDGILTECSIGYTVEKFLVDEKEETYTATKWEVFECSMVSIPADYTVGVGREFAEEEKRIEIETKELTPIRENEKSNSQEQERSQKREGKPSMDTLTPEQIEAKANEAKQAGQREERERVGEINRLTKHFAEKGLGGRKIDTSELAAKFISEGKTVAEFRDAVQEGTFKDVKPIQTPDEGEGLNRAKNSANGGHFQVVGDRSNVIEATSLGELFTKSKEYLQRNKSDQKCVVEIDGMTNYRATFTTGSVSGFNGIIQLPNINLLGVQRPTVADLLGQGVTNLTSVPFVRETAFTNAAATVAEGGAKPEATFALEQTSAPVRKIAVTIPVTDEAFEDIDTLRSYIDARLRYSVEMAEEAQLLSGDGTNANLTGILNTSNIQTQAKGSDTVPDAIHKGIYKIKVNGFANPTGIVMHPNDFQDLKLSKDANGQYFGNGPFSGSYGTPFSNVERVWGLPVVETTSMTENTALILTGTDAMIFRKKGITIDSTNSHASEFTSNIVRIRAEERLALAVFRPKSFCTVTGI